jgi:hypothetical protein
MRNLTRLLGIITLAAAIGFSLTGCPPEPDHTHTWGAWQSNATQHWKECTANDGAKTDIANHTGDPCTVCGYESPTVPEPTTVSLSFVSPSGIPADGNFNVTVKSDDAYLPDVWTGLVNSVKVALETTYASPDVGGGDRAIFREVFGVADATVVLKNDLATNWEVKAGVLKGVLYVKTSTVSTMTVSNYVTAVGEMSLNLNTSSVPLSFGTVENPCSVTIISRNYNNENFADDKWDMLIVKVIAAIMRGYNKDMGTTFDNNANKVQFEGVFGLTGNSTIALSSSALYDCEVKLFSDVSRIYLKADDNAIDGVDIQPAIVALTNNTAYTN